MNDPLPEDYCAPVHRSLTEPMLMAGIPRKMLLSIWMPGMYFVLGFRIYGLLLLLAAAHVVAAALCRSDPYFFEVLTQNRGQRNIYHP